MTSLVINMAAHQTDTDPWDWRGARAVVATMHSKQHAIADGLRAMELSFAELAAGFDTDCFGTFTRDIARAGDQREAARAKALAALERLPEARIGIASEGAFGPHPALPMLPGGFEIVLALDRLTGRELIGSDRTFETNYAQRIITTPAEAEAFAAAIGFPHHGIIVMDDVGQMPINKDIADPQQLHDVAGCALRANGRVWLETDMRAHRNPTRMASIARAARNLAAIWAARCPRCAQPGWIAAPAPGRPCAWCGGATGEHWTDVFQCGGCGHRETVTINPDHRADPGACPNCNP